MTDDDATTRGGFAFLSPGAADADDLPALEPGGPAAEPSKTAAWVNNTGAAVGREFDPVYFGRLSAEIDERTRPRLREYADWLAANPRVWMILEGNTDASSTLEYAFQFGWVRADAVRRTLIGFGVEPARLFLISWGEERPAVAGDDPADHAMNRRVEFNAFLAPDDSAEVFAADAGPSPPPPHEPEKPPEAVEIR